MKITVITSCTDSKTLTDGPQLSFDCVECEVPAQDLYSGEQHTRLMRGVRAAAKAGVEVDLWIVSAGYGLVPASTKLPPYNATFNDMPPDEARKRADELGVAEQVRQVLSAPADYALILLGDRYLDVCRFDKIDIAPRVTWALCATGSVSRFSKAIEPIPLHKADTRRFNAGLIGLKGEVAARILEEPHARFETAVQRIKGRVAA